MRSSRRRFLQACGVAGAGLLTGAAWSGPEQKPSCRVYHVCLSPEALEADPDVLDVARQAGVSDVWLTGFLYGYWYFPLDKTLQWRRRVEAKGMAAHVINVPLGHPGDSLGSKSGSMPLTPPKHWHLGTGSDGKTFAGTSLHPPATEENVAALKRLEAAGFRRAFVDDDFRLARGPGVIGGCYCDEHKREFLKCTGYGEPQWHDLLEAVRQRQLTPVLRNWIDFTCDQLTASFRAQQAAAPRIHLGNMIMFLGSEKAGIRLADYRDALFRVGEGGFGDSSFGPLKGKTDELFSVLFHRRYARAELAYSETTAYPADRLSAANMAAKLVISTIGDVRNSMYMSGIRAFPRSHWDTLAPAMRRQAQQHARLAGHRASGPLKHYWGEHSRYAGDDNAYSLFLAMGIPFEVCGEPARDGFTFLSEADARACLSGALRSPGTTFVARQGASSSAGKLRIVPENMADLFALKREIVARLTDTPYVEQDVPVVCAWYPTARSALLWNLTRERQELTLRTGDRRRNVSVAALDSEVIEIA